MAAILKFNCESVGGMQGWMNTLFNSDSSYHAGDSSAPWGAFIRTPAVWAIIVAHFCYNYGYYTLLAWLPSYFELALGLPVDSSSLLTLIPYVTMVIMTPFVGPVADGLVKKGWTITRVRKLAQVGP